MYNEITWVSASITGTKLQIELREGDLKTSGREAVLPANLIADEDAVITNMVVRRGTASVHYGDEVKKGDVLIEGKVYIYNEDETLKKVDYLTADGDIYGEYQQVYEKNYQRKHEVRQYSGKNHQKLEIAVGRKLVEIPDWQAIFREKGSKDTEEIWSWKKQFRLTPTFYLPFTLYYTEYVPYRNTEKNYTDEELKQMAEEDLQKYLRELEKKGVQIIANSVTISLDADGGHAKGMLTLDGPIGKEALIRSEQMAWTRQK